MMIFGGMQEPRYWPRSESRANLNVRWWILGVSHRDREWDVFWINITTIYLECKLGATSNHDTVVPSTPREAYESHIGCFVQDGIS